LSLGQSFTKGMRAIFGGVQSASSDYGWLVRAIGGEKTKAGVHVDEWNALRSSPIWACVTLIADCMTLLPVQVIERQGDRRRVVPDHPVQAILNSAANEQMGATTTIGTGQMHALTFGNAYLEQQRNRRGDLIGLMPLLPDRTQPHLEVRDGRRRITYRTTIDGQSYELMPDEVVHVFGYSFDGLCGISPIRAQRNAVGLALALEEFGSKFFENDAKSGGFLMHPGKLGDKGRENLRNSFDSESGDQGGLRNAHKIKILEEGAKFVTTTISPEDSQFLGTREFQLAEAARIFRVPLVLLQSLQGSTVWGTGIESLMIGFARYTISPWVRRWESELTRKLLSEAERAQGREIHFDMNALMRADSAARAAFYREGITQGWMTRNEARGLEDMNPLDGLDEPLIQGNMAPASGLSEQGRRALAQTEANKRALQKVIEGRAITDQTEDVAQ